MCLFLYNQSLLISKFCFFNSPFCFQIRLFIKAGFKFTFFIRFTEKICSLGHLDNIFTLYNWWSFITQPSHVQGKQCDFRYENSSRCCLSLLLKFGRNTEITYECETIIGHRYVHLEHLIFNFLFHFSSICFFPMHIYPIVLCMPIICLSLWLARYPAYNAARTPPLRWGPAQNFPFALILWYIAKTIPNL